MRPLYHINEKLNEIAGDKMPIGGTTEDNYQYVNHELKLETGDTLYMLSDGYSDQFGGMNGKKFMSGNLKKLLLSIQNQSLKEQKHTLDKAFESWRGNLEQVDDVCVIGIKI
jgi:serine phosphatase RsbU (regulator of sigma subunit)